MKRFLSRASILMVCVWALSISVSAVKMLVPVGQVVGLELQDHSVTIASFDEALGAAAQKAGLKKGTGSQKLTAIPWNLPRTFGMLWIGVTAL